MKPTRANTRTLAERIGVAVYVDLDHAVDLTAPPGKVFGSTGTHMLHAPCAMWGSRFAVSEAYRSVIEDMEDGLEDCEEPECDMCEEMALSTTVDSMGGDWIHRPEWAK